MKNHRTMLTLVALVLGFGAPGSTQTHSTTPVRQAIPTRRTEAFIQAPKLHAKELALLDSTAGLWIVEDQQGKLVSSGVASKLPVAISSQNLTEVVPGSANKTAVAFGIALTPPGEDGHVHRAAYVVVE